VHDRRVRAPLIASSIALSCVFLVRIYCLCLPSLPLRQVVEKYNRLDRLTGCSTDVQWYNMYGAPEFKNEKLLSNLKKGATAVAKAAQSTFSEEIDYTVSDVPFSLTLCAVWCGIMCLLCGVARLALSNRIV
jgi:hypothetical protein